MASFMRNVPMAMMPELAEIYRGAPGRVRRGEMPGTSRNGKGKGKTKGKGSGRGKVEVKRSGSSKDYAEYWGDSEDDENMEERMENMGFTNDEVHELLSQGVKLQALGRRCLGEYLRSALKLTWLTSGVQDVMNVLRSS